MGRFISVSFGWLVVFLSLSVWWICSSPLPPILLGRCNLSMSLRGCRTWCMFKSLRVFQSRVVVVVVVVASSSSSSHQTCSFQRINQGTEAAFCCPSGWSAYDQNCYKVFKEEMNWADAEKFCTEQHKGSHLVSLHNIAEADFVVKKTLAMLKDGVIWMGLNDVWNECNWGWTDGAKLDYKAWNEGTNCFVFKIAKNHWSHMDCSRTHNFVCKFRV